MWYRLLCIGVFSCFLLFLAGPATAQVQPMGLAAESVPMLPIARPSLPTIVKQVNEVNLLLSVTNAHGHFVQNLNPSDLAISDNGQPPEKITYFQKQTDLPLRVALVIDSSDSVSYRFGFEQKSAQAFLKKVLRPKDDIGLVIGFNQHVALVQPATSDFSALAAGIHKLKTGGETAVYDAIGFAADQLAALPDDSPVRRIVVLVTDGEDNRSHIGLKGAIEHALRAESVIYVVNTRDMVVTDEDKMGQQTVEKLAEATGGRVLSGTTDDQVSDAFRKIQQELRTQYALGYEPRHLLGGLFRTIRIFGPKGVRIRCRNGYYTH